MAGQHQCLLTEGSHGVGVGVGEGEGMVGTTIVEIHLNQGCVIVVMAADHTHKIVYLLIKPMLKSFFGLILFSLLASQVEPLIKDPPKKGRPLIEDTLQSTIPI